MLPMVCHALNNRGHQQVSADSGAEADLPLRIPCVAADEFEEECGCSNVAASPGLAAENLRYGLWACWDMFTR
jgi:hypothetical protein